MSNMPHEAAPGSAPQPLGVLLVGNGLLSQDQLSAALAEQQQTGRPLGEIVVGHGWVSGPLVAQALATQRGGLTKTEYGYATGFPSGDEAAAPAAPVAPPPVSIEVPARPALRLATPPPVSSDSELRAQAAATDPIVPLVPPPALEQSAPAPAVEPLPPTPAVEAEAQPASESPEIEALRERIAELEMIADAAATNTETARAQAAAAQADLQAAQTETEAMRERLTALEQGSGAGEAETLRARLAELDATVGEAKSSEAAAIEQLQAAQAEADALRERLAAVEAQATDSSEADALRARVAELESTISEAKQREAEALEQLHSAAAERGELEAARVEADALRRKLAELEEQAGQSVSAEARVSEASAREAHALEQLGAATAERDDLRRRVTDLEQDLRSATARRDLLAEEAEASKSRAGELEAIAAGLRAELETRPHETESTDTNDAMQARLAQLEHRLDGAHHQLSALQGSSELLADVERRLAGALSEQAATSAKMRMLEKELAERTRAYVEVADELARVHGAGAGQTDEQPETRHLVFATIGTAYEIVELDGAPPAPGDVIELDSGRHLVVRIGASPLAGSRLPCAYTIPA